MRTRNQARVDAEGDAARGAARSRCSPARRSSLYLNSYRDSLKAQGALVTVLVAKQTIPKGTSGSVVASKALYTVDDDPREPAARGRDQRPGELRDRSRPARSSRARS